MVNCIILNDDDRKYVETGVETGELFNLYGDSKGYTNDAECHPAKRTGGGTNPDPVFILNAAILDNSDFATMQPYLSGLPQKDSGDATFPPPLPPPH